MYLLRINSLSKRAIIKRSDDKEVRATKFKLKKNKKKASEGDELRERNAQLQKFERYGKILYGGRIVKPKRTPEELEEARRMITLRRDMLNKKKREIEKRETFKIQMRIFATENLPTEALKIAAQRIDTSPIPPDFIIPLIHPPKEEIDIFGPLMEGKKPPLLSPEEY